MEPQTPDHGMAAVVGLASDAAAGYQRLDHTASSATAIAVVEQLLGRHRATHQGDTEGGDQHPQLHLHGHIGPLGIDVPEPWGGAGDGRPGDDVAAAVAPGHRDR